MNRSKIIIFALLVLLIASNAYWTYHAFDQGVTLTYNTVSFDDHKQALDQTILICALAASGQGSRENIISSMKAEFGLSDAFDKEGFLWIGKLGLRFDDSGRLLEVQPIWN